VKAEQTLAAAEVADHLEALGRAVRAGAMTVRVGDRAVGLRLGDTVSLKVRAGRRHGREVGISLRLTGAAADRIQPGHTIEIVPMAVPLAMTEPAGEADDERSSVGDADGAPAAMGAEASYGAPTEGGVPEERAGAPRTLDGEP
jgi:amphi-Trp domain-containing protein